MFASDLFLTMKQCKELQDLNVDFSNTCYAFYSILNPDDNEVRYELRENKFAPGIGVIPTLSNTEMLEMLPRSINHRSLTRPNDLTEYKFKFMLNNYRSGYRIMYLLWDTDRYVESISFQAITLRDALYDTIKWLKENKLI
jgi:hypothetical protein